jgi:polysaccharide biosynthesis protein PslG
MRPATKLVRVLFAVCALLAPLGLFVPGAASSPAVRFGIQDDAWLEFGPGKLSDRVARLDRLGLEVVRITLPWHRTEWVQGRYDWRRSDRLLRALDARGLDPVVTLWGTPEWAGDGGPNSAPTNPDDFASFTRAAAIRYPFVRHWTIWNEPNKIIWLKPVSPQLYVSRILNPAYRAIKAANPSAKVAGGVTAPRGGQGGMAPVDFIRGMDRAGARLDAYAHHPYPDYPGDTPYTGGCMHCKTISMSTLERLLREVGKAFPKARIWLTEYGYQSKPDPFGVTPSVQARFVAEAARRVYAAPKVEMLIHYLYRDEPDLARWQSGLETVDGKAKPALDATMLPLTQVSRTGTLTTLWGQVRPGDGPQRYVLELKSEGDWIAVSGVQQTSARGYLRRTVRAPKGSQLRIWYPARDLASPALIVR